MKMKTNKERVLEVGNERSAPKCKKYEFEIKNYEKPIAFLGTI